MNFTLIIQIFNLLFIILLILVIYKASKYFIKKNVKEALLEFEKYQDNKSIMNQVEETRAKYGQ